MNNSDNKDNKVNRAEFFLPDLPDAPDFISEPPKYTLAEMIKLSQVMLPYWNKIRYSKPEPEFVGDPFVL